jgi:hypothetical protein
MRTHYDVYASDYGNRSEIDWGYTHPCGTLAAEKYSASENWLSIDCRRCIKFRKKIERRGKENQDSIINEMGRSVEFYEKESGKFRYEVLKTENI